MSLSLILGAGYSADPDKKLVRLDNNPDTNPDVLWDLNKHPLPFEDEMFDEIYAYEVLEHLGRQGDYRFFFAEFSEYWRILKPFGLFRCSFPKVESVWAFGDPGHSRVLMPQTLSFLNQDYYKQVGKTALSDYRRVWKHDLKMVDVKSNNDSWQIIMQKQ